MLRIYRVETEEDIENIKTLFSEYESSLNFDLDFQDFNKEFTDLPGEYAFPIGCLLLVDYEDQVAGCVAMRKITDEICEMKRLYVRPHLRRKGIGKKLAIAIIEEAKKIGYKYMRLDTVPSMNEAITLYRTLGFKSIESYRYNPIEGALFFELELL